VLVLLILVLFPRFPKKCCWTSLPVLLLFLLLLLLTAVADVDVPLFNASPGSQQHPMRLCCDSDKALNQLRFFSELQLSQNKVLCGLNDGWSSVGHFCTPPLTGNAGIFAQAGRSCMYTIEPQPEPGFPCATASIR